jgi:hypothetical protein
MLITAVRARILDRGHRGSHAEYTGNERTDSAAASDSIRECTGEVVEPVPIHRSPLRL